MIMYLKEKGFDSFFKVDFDIRKSNKGYQIATAKSCEEVSKYAYYKSPEYLRYIHILHPQTGMEIHEIGNSGFFEKLNKSTGE